MSKFYKWINLWFGRSEPERVSPMELVCSHASWQLVKWSDELPPEKMAVMAVNKRGFWGMIAHDGDKIFMVSDWTVVDSPVFWIKTP